MNEKEYLMKVESELKKLNELELFERIQMINKIKKLISKYSPFKDPVDVVQWVPSELVIANDYNPNRVAPPEMSLLKLSIEQDGFTQPIVTYKEDIYFTIVDGFHRNRVGKEYRDITEKLYGHLPIVVLNKQLQDRMASTIRHNRARGTHAISPMSKVVEELYFLGWSDTKIAEQLGMEKDEVLRLKQFTGLGNLFKHREFSKSWE